MSMKPTPSFEKWFGDSKVVNSNGAPLVVYHGTTGDIKEFDFGRLSHESGNPASQLGMFFTPSPEIASDFARDAGDMWSGDDDRWPNVIPVYLAIKNPHMMTYGQFKRLLVVDFEDHEARAEIDDLVADLVRQGHDGVKIGSTKAKLAGSEFDAPQWVTFRSDQIKSAIGNNGEFDAANTDIRFSLVDLDDAIDTEAPCP